MFRWSTGGEKELDLLAARVYADTKLDDGKETMLLLNKPSSELIASLKTMEPIKLYRDLLKTYQEQVQAKLNEIQGRINQLQRTYMQAQMEVFKEKTFYPDANSTLRVAYG